MLLAIILLWIAFLLMCVAFIYVLGELNEKLDMTMVVVAETILKGNKEFSSSTIKIVKKGEKENE